MRIAIVGDLESSISQLYKFQTYHKDLDLIIQLGDFGFFMNLDNAKKDKKVKNKLKLIEENQKNLTRSKVPIWFIKGLHEDFDSLKTYYLYKNNIKYIEPSTVKTLCGVNFGFIGGFYSKTHYNSGQDQKYMKKWQIDNLMDKRIDILCSYHGPFKLASDLGNEGAIPITNLIKSKKPKKSFHGHHHKNYRKTYNTTEIVGLGNFAKNKNSSYILNI